MALETGATMEPDDAEDAGDAPDDAAGAVSA